MAGRQMNRPAAFYRTGANLGPTKILQDRNLALGTPGSRTDARVGRGVCVVGAMGKVEADDVDTGGDKRVENGIVVGRRPNGRDDLGLSHRIRVPGSWF